MAAVGARLGFPRYPFATGTASDPTADVELDGVRPPLVFLSNGAGQIVYQHNNYEPGDENELYRKVQELVGKK